jgi:uncharacterized protein YutE (UPF0331/DUF86 family)
MAASAAAQEAMWMNRLLQQLGFKTSQHHMKTTRLLYSLQIILEITVDLTTLIHGVTTVEKL